MTLTYYEANRYINHNLRQQAATFPATNYLAFFTSVPDRDGSGDEVVDASYARQAITLGAPSPDGQTHNTNTITFPGMSADVGDVIYGAIYDAATGGNMRMFAPFAQPFTLYAGTAIEFDPGQLVFSA